ncbi:hypothetical protein [Nevskia sp.]|uniref:hypothetical protein n=1 Tax=Nevskia sp. TaxID=1929292 RepID=UPI0025ED5407|nr:hypothetical protein [Nevskia sp.]
MTEQPLLLLDCDRHASLRLTVTSCAGMWNKARLLPNGSLEPVMKCRGCAIGAANAGMKPEMSREIAADAKGCTRCRRGARKLIFGDLCLSCYNRQTELRRGINRMRTRGKVFWPKFARPLRVALVAVRQPDELSDGRILTFDHVADGLEVALRTVRRSHGEVLIAFSRPWEPGACVAH